MSPDDFYNFKYNMQKSYTPFKAITSYTDVPSNKPFILSTYYYVIKKK